MMSRVLLFMFGLLSFGWLNMNNPPAPAATVRCIVHERTKRAHAKILSGAALLRSLFASVCGFFDRLGGFAPHMARAGTLNLYLDPLPDFPFQAAAIKENLPRSVHLRDLLVRITGTLTVSAGATDGVLMTEPISRLIRQIRVRWDGLDLVAPMPLRDLAALSRRLTVQPLTGTPVTIPGIQVTNFELRTIIPFARFYNADPFETALPALQTRKEFHIEMQYETGLSNAVAGTTQGSAAFVAGGDRVVALTNVNTQIIPRQARSAGTPWFIPLINSYETVQIAAANPRLPLKMESNNPFDAIMFRVLNGANQDPADILTDLTFETQSVKVFEDVTRQQLRTMEESEFGGVQQVNEVGTHFVRFADGGKLGNVVDPSELVLPEFRFNMAAPAGGGPAIVRAVVMELARVPGITRQ